MSSAPRVSSLTVDFSSQLTASLSAEVNIAAELLSLLEEEPTVVASSDHQAILNLSHRKQNLAEKLAQGEIERHRFLEGAGLPINLSALESALKEAGAEDIASVCCHLKQVVAVCAEYNRSNGILVENRLRHVLRALEIVTGQASEMENRAITYGQRNRLGQRSSGRTWAKV